MRIAIIQYSTYGHVAALSEAFKRPIDATGSCGGTNISVSISSVDGPGQNIVILTCAKFSKIYSSSRIDDDQMQWKFEFPW